jgi:hypothetical protein
MTYEDAVEIERLARNVVEKQEILQAHRIANTPTDYDERQEALVRLHMVHAEYLDAHTEYLDALGKLTMRPRRE